MLRTMRGRPAHAVTAEVRLWHDLGIAGEDFIALIDELHRAFGVTLAGELTVYCPPEYEAILALGRDPNSLGVTENSQSAS